MTGFHARVLLSWCLETLYCLLRPSFIPSELNPKASICWHPFTQHQPKRNIGRPRTYKQVRNGK